MRLSLLCLLTFSFNAIALNFNQYCQYNAGEQDCSAEFLQALTDANNTDEAIVFSADTKYLITNINTKGLFLNGTSIIGEAKNSASKAIINTDGIYLFDINNLTIDNIKIMGVHNEDTTDVKQGNSLLLIGAKDRLNKVTSININNVDFENSAEDLLVFWNTEKVTVTKSTFRRSGMAMRIAPIIGDPNDLRPRGSGLLFHNIIDAKINFNEFYEMKKFAIFLDGSDLIDHDISISNNHIDMLSFENPTQRYGLKGGAGIYLGNSTKSKNVTISNNRIINYTMNGMRINGSNILIENNNFNFKGECTQIDDSISGKLVGMAIKSHFLIDAEIIDNCIRNTRTGVALESWDNIENITISGNKIIGAELGFWVKDEEGGISSNITIENNSLITSDEDKKTSSGTSSPIALTIFSLIFFLRQRYKD